MYNHAYVTVFWKTDLMVINPEIYFCLYPKITLMHYPETPNHLRQDGHAGLLNRWPFSNGVKPQGCTSWLVWTLGGINKTARGAKLWLFQKFCSKSFRLHSYGCCMYITTVEPLLKDTPNKGHNTFDLSIKDKFCGPYRTMAIQFYL